MPDSGAPVNSKRPRRLHYSSIELLGALALLFVFIPFLEEMRYGAFIEVLLMTLVFVSAFFAVRSGRYTRYAAGVLTGLAVAGKWLDHFLGPAAPAWMFPPIALCFVGFIIVHLVRSALLAPRVDAQVLCAAIAAYLFFGLFWAIAYMFAGRLSPEAFAFSASIESGRGMTRFDAFYFSFVTLSTVGYGDITPVSKVARMLAVTEAMTGMLYVAVLIARLVSLYSATPKSSSDSR